MSVQNKWLSKTAQVTDVAQATTTNLDIWYTPSWQWHSLARKIFYTRRNFPPRTPITNCKKSQLSKSYVGRGSSWVQVFS